jgi:hypothetical protein
MATFKNMREAWVTYHQAMLQMYGEEWCEAEGLAMQSAFLAGAVAGAALGIPLAAVIAQCVEEIGPLDKGMLN